MEIIRKAYTVDFGRIDEGYLADGDSFVSTEITKGKCKSELVGMLNWEDYKLHNGDDITYLNIPIVRIPKYDIIKHDGVEISKSRYKEIMDNKVRLGKLDAILNDDNITHCHILKRGSYYASNYCGYTSIYERAGVYLKKDAVDCAKGCDELDVSPIKTIEHNNKIHKSIERLQSKIIR